MTAYCWQSRQRANCATVTVLYTLKLSEKGLVGQDKQGARLRFLTYTPYLPFVSIEICNPMYTSIIVHPAGLRLLKPVADAMDM